MARFDFSPLALVMLTLCSLCSAPAHADGPARDRSASSGLALGAGFGNDTAGVGGVVHYYLQIPESRFRVALHAGMGGQWVGLGTSSGWKLGISGGVMGSFGRRHRFIVDLYAAPSGAFQELSFHGEEASEWRPLYGVGINVGWEWMSRVGFYMRASIGPVYAFSPRIYRAVGLWNVSGNLITLGYKLW
jgi:hypothetical protein